jgi:hypothetical protein
VRAGDGDDHVSALQVKICSPRKRARMRFIGGTGNDFLGGNEGAIS